MTIPIFYTISDDFTPYLAVSVSSLVKHASPEKDYTIIILHQGLSQFEQYTGHPAPEAAMRAALMASLDGVDES